MSEMFTKCNGFIVSGDPLVYADSATMSGQGTISEPFGVKSIDLFVQEPLYTGTSGNSAYIGWNNETVLFTAATGSPTTGTVVMSEPPSAFERVKVLEGRGYDNAIFHEFSGTQPDWNMTSVIIANGGSNFIIDAGKWSISNNSANKVSDQRVTCGSTYVKEGGSFPKGIYAVIGINRKV